MRLNTIARVAASAVGLLLCCSPPQLVKSQICGDLGGSLATRFEAPVTDVVCFNQSTATCPSGVSYFDIDYDCSVASEGAERCFCTSDDRCVRVCVHFMSISCPFHR